MTHMDFLLWVRGPAFDFAVLILVFGLLVRLIEILALGHKPDFSEARASGMEAGFGTIFRRMLPAEGMLERAGITIVAGYVFHLGLFITLFLFAPHIELFHAMLGVKWPGLPTPLVDFAAVMALVALVAILIRRLTHPVLKHLSGAEDYLVWALTFLPILTGYLAFHHLLLPYTQMLALHILSVELLMICFPFTKLMHTFTLFLARYYNGALAGRKGVRQ